MKKFLATLLAVVLIFSSYGIDSKAKSFDDNVYMEAGENGVENDYAGDFVSDDEIDYEYDFGNECNDSLIEVVDLDDDEVNMLRKSFALEIDKAEYYSRSWSMYSSNYCFSKMNEAEQEFYNRLDEVVMHYMNSDEDAVFREKDSNYYLKGATYSDLDFARFDAAGEPVLNKERATEIAIIYWYQNPQYYFVSTWILRDDDEIYLGCISDFADGQERFSVTADVFARIDGWLAETENIPSEYGKALKIRDIVCNNVVYLTNSYDQSLYSAVILGETVCAGYTKLYSVLANAAGLDGIGIISGTHAWNKVKIDGKWYNVDTTWDDDKNTRDYFCRSDTYFLENGAHLPRELYDGLLPEAPYDHVDLTATVASNGIYEAINDREKIVAGMVTTATPGADIEYCWYVKSGDGARVPISDWTDSEWLWWYPDKWGTYNVECDARIVGNEDSTVNAKASIEYHPHIKGVCQMPYEGGGFLIGVESYDNPGQKYSYELLILDCTLLSKGEPAWIYTTGKNTVEYGNAFWAVWKPQYGYYWTLFRVFDEEGSIIDEKCYGFVNI